MTTQVKPGQRIIRCVDCDAPGIEDENDPFPGICPACLKKKFDCSLKTVAGLLSTEGMP
jgi:hypothetical protein